LKAAWKVDRKVASMAAWKVDLLVAWMDVLMADQMDKK
jgi:hypothetical protein